LHVSSLTTGAQREHPQTLPPSPSREPTVVVPEGLASVASADASGVELLGEEGEDAAGVAGVVGVVDEEPSTAPPPQATTRPKMADETKAKENARGRMAPLYLDTRSRRAHDPQMADSDKPSPIEDLRKGLGLLFRAAKTTLEQIPTGELEKAVVSSAKEVGRAIENVTHTVEKQIFRKPGSEAPPSPEKGPEPKAEASADAKDAPHDPNKGDGAPNEPKV
jgi:hypothetical protein